MGVTGNIDNPGGNLLIKCAFDIEKRYGLGDFKIPRENYAGKLHAFGRHRVVRHRCLRLVRRPAACGGDGRALHAPDHLAAKRQPAFVLGHGRPAHVRGHQQDPVLRGGRPVHDAYRRGPCRHRAARGRCAGERNAVRTWWTPARSISKCTTYYEAKSDEQIILDLGRRLKPENWPWKDDEELSTWYLTDQYAKGGTRYEGDFHELQERGGYKYDPWDAEYYKYEKGMCRPDGNPGFDTATGRFEFWSWGYNHWGVDPMPYHIEPKDSPVSTPEKFQEYPLIATSGGRSYEFFHSEHRQLETMREFHPWPLVTMHPDTAAEYGIEDGDWVWIETTHGRCRQKAFLFPGIKPNTIHMEHAWWFPEEEAAEPSLYGTFDSNINNMALNFETGQGGIGSGIKSFLARIYKYEEGDQMPGEKVTREGGWGDYIPGVMAGDKESAEKQAAEGNTALQEQLETARRVQEMKVKDAEMQGRNALIYAKEHGEAPQDGE